MKNIHKKNRNSLEMMSSPSEANERLFYSTHAIERLTRYRDTVNKLERSVGTEKHLADRARSAENDTRVILKCAIDSLNEMRDSRAIEDIAREGAKFSGKGEALDFSKAIKGAKEVLREKMPEINLTFLDECLAVLQQHELDIRFDEDIINTRINEPNGDKHEVAFSSKVQPGDVGRVSIAEFFGTTGPITTLSNPALADDDCHHNSEQNSNLESAQLVDPYASTIAAFAYARDAMARHTKVVDYFGRPHLKANPAAVALAIIIVSAVLTVVGATIMINCAHGTWDGSVCDWGLPLFVSGLAVGVVTVCIVSGCLITLAGGTLTMIMTL